MHFVLALLLYLLLSFGSLYQRTRRPPPRMDHIWQLCPGQGVQIQDVGGGAVGVAAGVQTAAGEEELREDVDDMQSALMPQ